ncbi:hypothetical protein [Limobrevibacterium gyesilva]|uniref:Lipoprotein n=1 Tax=Limobrevibacterium gyesilva TaxID=2991712 RepID=A0AA41YWC4_9PROT|nr:hypothetical protein [Limobrevibacterium gyesilva]MCW3476577.1 hypothetical protein [Limobrevibacterium gyesilva]
MRLATLARTLPLLLILAACARADNTPLMSTKSPVELRAMQSRSFATPDRAQTLRQVIATLQDLGYSLDKVEAAAGTVTATKLAALRMTATVIPRGTNATVVRANALVNFGGRQHQVDEPLFYQQNFFAPLAGAMLVQALPGPALEEGTAPATPATAPPPARPGS